MLDPLAFPGNNPPHRDDSRPDPTDVAHPCGHFFRLLLLSWILLAAPTKGQEVHGPRSLSNLPRSLSPLGSASRMGGEKGSTDSGGGYDGRTPFPLLPTGSPGSHLLAARAPAVGVLLAARALAALYLYAFGFLNHRRTMYGDLQDAVLKARVDLALVHVLGQLQASAERAGADAPSPDSHHAPPASLPRACQRWSGARSAP